MALSKSFGDGEVLRSSDVNAHLVNHVPAPGDPYDTGWTPITVLAGYVAQENLAVRRVGMQVYLRGAISTAGSTPFPTAWTRVATIPAGFRPGNYHRYAGTAAPSATARGAEVAVATGGDLSIGPVGTSTDICRVNTTWMVN